MVPLQIQRLAMISVHASPLSPMGDKKTGGMNVYVRKVAQEFAQRGVLVDIYTRRTSAGVPQIDRSLHENVRVIHIPVAGLQPLTPDALYPHLSAFTAGVLVFAAQDHLMYDLIYSHYWLSGWVAHKIKHVWNVPFVQMFHTLGQMKDRIASDRTSVSPRATVEAQIMTWADHIIAATPAEQAQLRWLYRARRRKISIVSPGVDLNQFHPVDQVAARARLNLIDNTQLLLFVGRIEPLKGVDTALQALAILRNERPDLTDKILFMIVGGNPDDPRDAEMVRLRRLAAELDLEKVVQFMGARDQSQLPEYYATAAAVIMPSDYESFGMVALEAMASGTPVIASEVGGLAFLVQDGITGFLVPVRDPAILAQRIITLLENPEQLRQMRLAAAELAQQYTWTRIADELMAVFSRVLVAHSSASPHTS